MIESSSRQLARSFLRLLALALAGIAVAHFGRSDILARVAVLVPAVVFLLAVLKSRLIVFDFLGMRAFPSVLRAGLLFWVAFFAVATVAARLLAPFLAG